MIVHRTEWKSSCTLVEIELGVREGDDPWPWEVSFYHDPGEFTLLAHDARRLASALNSLADLADEHNARMVSRRRSCTCT